MIKLSVIIPAYNCESFIGQSIQSVWAVANSETEVIVVDDGSTDATREIANELSRSSPLPMRVVGVSGGMNRGPGAARNRGITLSEGMYVAFLDADDYYLPGRFDEDIKRLEREKTVDGICGLTRIEFENETGKPAVMSEVEYIGLPPSCESDQVLPYLLREQFWHANALTIRRSALLQTGGFCEQLPMAEDCLLWFKLAAVEKVCSSASREPVAAYRRRRNSTHTFSVASQDCLLRSMAIATLWAQGEHLPAKKYRLLCRGTRAYLEKIIDLAMASGNISAAQHYLHSVYQILGWRFWGAPHVARLALGVLLKDAINRIRN